MAPISDQSHMPEILSSRLIDLVFTRLPRELRDKIYIHIWDTEAVQIINKHLPDLLEFNDHENILASPLGLLVTLITQKNAFGKELMQALYETSTGLEIEKSLLYDFIERDIFRSEITPLNVMLRALIVRMYLRGMDEDKEHYIVGKLSHVVRRKGFRLHIVFDPCGLPDETWDERIRRVEDHAIILLAFDEACVKITASMEFHGVEADVTEDLQNGKYYIG